MRVYLIISAMLLIPFSYIFANENPSDQRTGANIYGHVVNKDTREHIPNIVIGVKGTTISTMTDNSGHFSFKHMPLGDHTIVAIGLGYSSVEKPVTSKSNETIEVEFEMESVIFEREQVVITANRNQTNKKETATIVNVLSDKQFSRTASSTLAESLNFGTGLRMEYNCSNCGVPQLRINGLNGQYSQILLDSRPIFSSLATVYGLEQLPTAMVERMEIIRGGGSALYGSNAIGGVVNIITKEPLRNSVTIANTTNVLNSKTTDVNNSMNGSFVSEDRKTGVYVFGMTRERKPYFRDNDNYSEMPELSSETLGFRGFYKTGMYSKITAEYHHIREFRRGGNKLDRPPHEADVAEQLRHQINGGGLKFDAFTPDQYHRVTLFTSAQIIDRDSYFGTGQNLNAYGTTFNRTFVGGGQYTYFMDRLLFSPSELTAGIEYNQDELNDRMLGYDRDLRQFTNTIGGFVQNEWKQEKYNILIGARMDKNKLVDKPIFSPRANVRYSPHDFIGFRASYASGYRAPQAYDEDLHVAAVGGEVALINVAEGLKPEYSHSLSGSVDLYKSLGQVETNLLIEGFYTTLKDVFVLEEMGHDSQNNLLLERRNGSGATVKGLNLEAMIGVRSVVELQMGYTFQSSRYKKAEVWVSDPVELSSKQMFRTPNNYGYITANFFVTPKFRAAIFGTHTGHMYVPHFAGYVADNSVKYTPQFFDMGCRLSYSFAFGQSTEVEISGGLKNILDQYQNDLDKGMSRDSKYIYGPSLPRTIFFGIKMSL